MRPITGKVKKAINSDQAYEECMLAGLHDHVCGGRITREHAIIHAGRQVNAVWAIISVCAAGQEVDEYQDAHTMKKELNVWIALNRATDVELRAISKATDYIKYRERLNKKYGPYIPKAPLFTDVASNYRI